MFKQSEIEDFYRGAPTKQAAATTMRNLERNTRFKEALDSEMGKLLFEDLIILLDEKFNLIVEGKESEQDKAIFKACQVIGERWNKRIKGYIGNCNTVSNVINK